MSAGKNCRAPPLFGSKSTISRFGERFRDAQYSLVSFLFAVLLLKMPPVPSHSWKWGRVPPCPRSRRHGELFIFHRGGREVYFLGPPCSGDWVLTRGRWFERDMRCMSDWD